MTAPDRTQPDEVVPAARMPATRSGNDLGLPDQPDTSELIERAKTTQLTYGSAGHGTVGNILTEMLKLATRADITHVPYKRGYHFREDVGPPITVEQLDAPSFINHLLKGLGNLLMEGGGWNGGKVDARLDNLFEVVTPWHPCLRQRFFHPKAVVGQHIDHAGEASGQPHKLEQVLHLRAR